MKKLMYTTAISVVALMLSVSTAQAEMPAAGEHKPMMGGMMDNMGKPEDFAARKQEILAHITEGMSRMEKTKTCVEAAADAEALKKCMMPPPGMMMMHPQGGMAPMGGGMTPPPAPAQEAPKTK